MSRSRFGALGTLVLVGCSVLLSEETEQCTRDADCAELGFTGAICHRSGVCVVGASGGSSGEGGSGAGKGGSTVGGEGAGALSGGGQGGADSGAAGEGGVVGLGGSLGGGGAGGSPPAEPTAVRPIGDSLTQTAGGSARLYVDTCPDDQVLVGVNGWSQPDANPPWLMRGQAVCGKLVLSPLADGYSITIDSGAVLRERGTGLVDDVQDPALCPANEVVVGFDGRAGVYMDQVRVYCAPLTVSGDPGARTLEIEAAVPGDSTGSTVGGGGFSALYCPNGQIARGAQLLAGAYFDGFGLVCGAPVLAFPDGAACTSDEDCVSADCVSDVCAAAPCTGLDGEGGAGGGPPTIAADCTCGLFNTRSYLFCSSSATFDQALTACSDAGLELVRLNNGAENGWLRSTSALRALGNLWIGASDLALEGEWRWASGTQFWQGLWNAGAPVGGLFNAWAGAQPDNAGPGEHCAEMYAESLWNDQACNQPRDFVCEPP